MRFGFHSGPVTAGVLRCERSRFQIFGDSGKKQDVSLYHGDWTRSDSMLTFLFILLIQSTQRQEWNGQSAREDPGIGGFSQVVNCSR